MSLVTGIFPNCLKTLIITRIYKNKNSILLENYRLISIVSSIAEIVKKQLITFLETYKLINSRQYGFRIGMGTHDAIDAFVSEMYSLLKFYIKLLSVFLNLVKVFDTVSHALLTIKLKNMRILETGLDWFESYLYEQEQCVKFKSLLNFTFVGTNYDVPHETVFEPMLFLALKFTGNVTCRAVQSWLHRLNLKY